MRAWSDAGASVLLCPLSFSAARWGGGGMPLIRTSYACADRMSSFFSAAPYIHRTCPPHGQRTSPRFDTLPGKISRTYIDPARMRQRSVRYILPWSKGKAALSGRLLNEESVAVAPHSPCPQLQRLGLSAWRSRACWPANEPKGLPYATAGFSVTDRAVSPR